MKNILNNLNIFNPNKVTEKKHSTATFPLWFYLRACYYLYCPLEGARLRARAGSGLEPGPALANLQEENIGFLLRPPWIVQKDNWAYRFILWFPFQSLTAFIHCWLGTMDMASVLDNIHRIFTPKDCGAKSIKQTGVFGEQ